MNKLENLKKKLIYRSSYRGTKEMDILLSSFVKKHIDILSETDLHDLSKVLDLEDEVIYNFYNNNFIDSPLKENKILQMIKDFKI
jgi:antitoxin CptB|tara:strand:+ start:968 stop:1222 length:255 start_codon:yes stop_codon:yes gene_type:complete